MIHIKCELCSKELGTIAGSIVHSYLTHQIVASHLNLEHGENVVATCRDDSHSFSIAAAYKVHD